MTALQQMEIAFDGDHSQEEIEPVLREAMRLYGLDWTEDARSRAGSVVVELRREFGPSEMEILDYMIRSHVEGVNVDFPEGAALAVTFLRSGDS